MPFDGRAFSPQQQEILEAIEVLERAREIVRHRWAARAWMAPGRYWGDVDDRPHYCAAGAIMVALLGEAESPAQIEQRYIANHAHLSLKTLERAHNHFLSIMAWNDASSHTDVIAGFERAIEGLSSQLERI